MTYQEREDETNHVHHTFIKEFKDEEEKLAWERSQSGHPFLHNHEIAREVVD